MRVSLPVILVVAAIAPSAWAAQAEIDSMKERVGKIIELKEKNCIGETRDGLVGVVKSCPGAQEVVDAENRDRRTIYKERAGDTDVQTVQRIIGEKKIEKEPAGRSVQDASGKWTTKE